MSADSVRKAFEYLGGKGEMGFLDGATKEQIEEFEASKEVELPSQYKDWLLATDGGELYLPAGVQLYGVAHKPLINLSDDSRPDDTYVVIGALSTGDPILCERSTERISIYNLHAGRIEDDESYPDFLSFLDDLENILGIED
jgi:hypothetical protein